MSLTDEALGTYLAAREAERLADVEDTLRGMNPRERRLVQEAAVMGYVRGVQAGRSASVLRNEDAKIPPGSVTLVDVVDACLSMPDLYPTMSRVLRVGQKRRESLNGAQRG